jgi:hypothetical protein
MHPNMVHLLLRIAVWVVVLGIGYVVFGPGLFDSTPDDSPFGSSSTIFLPPAKSQRHLEYDAISRERALSTEELADYRELVQQRQSRFWQQQGVSVEQALAGVETHRKEHLATILEQRGLTKEEAAVFLFVVERDHPALLKDRE